jgi:hypothetical protein
MVLRRALEARMAVVLAPVGDARPQFFTDAGAVLSGGKLYFYAAGTSTLQSTYTDSTGGVANANPVVLDSDGRAPNGIWFTQGLAYKIVAQDSSGNTLWTEDQLRGVNDVTVTQDEWVASGLTPTYVSATSFTLSGDQTTAFHAGRRLKTTNSGGTIYSVIKSASYSSPNTTVTVVNDSGSLDAGLSAVSYGLQSANNPSKPILTDTYPIVSGSSDKTKKLRMELDTNVPADTTVTATVPGEDYHAGFRNTPINSQSAAYTTVLADAGKTILHPAADNNARTFTIDSNANVAYPLGTTITFANLINTVTIAITSDTMTLAGSSSTGNRTLAANGIATAVKVTSTSWLISGSGLS